MALAKAFNCGVNELPLSLVLSWYEQKAVCILLTLLALGIQNIRIGPSLPAFISPNVLKVLVEKFNGDRSHYSEAMSLAADWSGEQRATAAALLEKLGVKLAD